MFKASFNRFSITALSCACATVLLAACGGSSNGDSTAADISAAAQSVASSVGLNSNTSQNASAAPNAMPAPKAESVPASTNTSTAAGTTPASSTAGTSTSSSSTSASTPTSTAGSTSSASTAPASSTPTPYGQDASLYTLSFNEDFNSFNSSLWNDHIWYQGSNATKNFTVENGALKIWPQRDASGNFFDRTIDTDGKYYQTYGYFEMEAKLPKGKGTWPAFWLFNHIGSRRPEMDIMEAYAGGNGWGYTDSSGIAHPDTYAATVWVGDYEGHQAGFKMYNAGVDLSAGFHKYAVKWEPNKQTYYLDGKAITTINVSMGDPMYIMLDLWFGSASGTPDGSTPQGKDNSYEVNYVRAWKFK